MLDQQAWTESTERISSLAQGRVPYVVVGKQSPAADPQMFTGLTPLGDSKVHVWRPWRAAQQLLLVTTDEAGPAVLCEAV